jgi:acetyl esterase/lipase
MRKSIFSLVIMTFLAAGAHAQIAKQMEERFIGQMLGNSGGTQIDLWSDGSLPQNGVDYNNLPANAIETAPKCEVFVPKSDKPVPVVVVCPGGGYMMTAIYHEGYAWRNFFERQGIATVLLNYRMPHGNHLVPASDVYACIRYLKAHARELNIDPNQIGVMGSSAGGHLASTVATHATEDVRPAFQILFYPVITMDASFTHQGSREGLLGKEPSAEMVRLYSNELQVTEKTPKAFIVLAADDSAVPPLNSARYYAALCEKGVPAVMHVYPAGEHGFGILETFPYHAQMMLELETWLKTIF